MQKFKKVVYAFASAKSIIFPTTEAPEFRHLLIATNARVRDAQLRPRANVHWRQQWRFAYTFAWVNLAKLRLISQLQVKIYICLGWKRDEWSKWLQMLSSRSFGTETRCISHP